jgi:predicted transcriptional regulator
MKSLTPAEETLMHALWTIERGFLKDIMEAYPEPRPHHNTVATVLKILVEKGF